MAEGLSAEFAVFGDKIIYRNKGIKTIIFHHIRSERR
jgi:hypothetical protein